MVSEVLHQGFILANRRLGVVLLDLFWKAIWLTSTIVVGLLQFTWLFSSLEQFNLNSTNIPVIDRLIAAEIVQRFGRDQATEILLVFFTLVVFSGGLWLCLSSYFRARMFAPGQFRVFMTSSVLRAAVLTSTASILILLIIGPNPSSLYDGFSASSAGTAGGALIGVVAFLGIAFLVTMVDTLVRADSVELLGKVFIELTGVIGVLVAFEMLIRSAVWILIIAAFLRISMIGEVFATFAIASTCIVLLSLLHSYLLLVRFSAVGIMRRDAVV